MDFRQIWYLQKGLFEENPMPSVPLAGLPPYASSVLSQLSFVSGRVWSVLEVRKGVLPSGTSRFWVFVSCNSCCEAGEWLQAWYIDGQEAYFDCDSRIPYIPCTILYGHKFFFRNSTRNPPISELFEVRRS